MPLWPSALLDLAFPPICVICGDLLPGVSNAPGVRWRGQGLCGRCANAIPKLAPPCCPLCAKPFPSAAIPSHLCSDCLLTPPPFDSARALLAYQEEVFPIIHQMKYGPRPILARFFGALLGEAFGEGLAHLQLGGIVPVPLHPDRLRKRGFNQAVLLARGLGTRSGVPLYLGSLERVCWTEPQVSLSRPRREANVRGAFAVADARHIEGKRLLLVDDVYTTGATLREAARTLKRGGAQEVHVVALARVL